MHLSRRAFHSPSIQAVRRDRRIKPTSRDPVPSSAQVDGSGTTLAVMLKSPKLVPTSAEGSSAARPPPINKSPEIVRVLVASLNEITGLPIVAQAGGAIFIL